MVKCASDALQAVSAALDDDRASQTNENRQDQPEPDKTVDEHHRAVQIAYTDGSGEIQAITIIPLSLRFGSSKDHPADQHLLMALDLDQIRGGVPAPCARREFAMANILHWRPLA